jgi:hypothetical protein
MPTTNIQLAPRPDDVNPTADWRSEAQNIRRAAGADKLVTDPQELPPWVNELVGLLVLAIAGALAAIAISQF